MISLALKPQFPESPQPKEKKEKRNRATNDECSSSGLIIIDGVNDNYPSLFLTGCKQDCTYRH